MIKWEELEVNKTKVLLPNDCVGIVTNLSPIKQMKGGLLRGRDKVKCRYTTPTRGETEAWFALSSLRKYEIVIKKIVTDVQPVGQGKEPWKTKDTFNGTPIVDPTKTEEVIVPKSTDNIIESDMTEEKLLEKIFENHPVNKLPDKTEEDLKCEDDGTELIG